MIPERELLADLKTQPLESVLEKYDISLQELFQLQLNRNYHNKESSYITRTRGGTYSITKSVNGVNYYFGSYADKKEAELIVEALIDCGWNIDELPGILVRLNIQSKSEKE